MKNNSRNTSNYAIGLGRMDDKGLLNELQRQIGAARAMRAQKQAEQREAWKRVKRGSNETATMARVDRAIGEATHKIDQVIGQIAKRGKSTEASALARRYLDEEIERNSKILKSRMDHREAVRAGRGHYIHDDGSVTTNPHADDGYIRHKSEQLERLKARRAKLR